MAIPLTFLAGHISTALITRFGCRITGLIGGAFCVVSLIASSFAENMWVLFFTYSILYGLGSSCAYSSGLVVISQFFKNRQSLASRVLSVGPGVGVLIMGPTLEALIKATGWQSTCRIMAGVVFALYSLVITYDPNVETDEKNSSKKGEEEEDEGEGRDKGGRMITKFKNVFDFSVWKEPPVIALILGVCVEEFGHFVPQIHLVSARKFLVHVIRHRSLFHEKSCVSGIGLGEM